MTAEQFSSHPSNDQELTEQELALFDEIDRQGQLSPEEIRKNIINDRRPHVSHVVHSEILDVNPIPEDDNALFGTDLSVPEGITTGDPAVAGQTVEEIITDMRREADMNKAQRLIEDNVSRVQVTAILRAKRERDEHRRSA